MDTSKITRVEVIDHRLHSEDRGRVFVATDSKMNVEAVLQDDDRTLKIFIESK